MTVRNIAASIRQRLLNKAREEKRPFNELLQYYAMERFLYRLSLSPYKNRFILKGALMLRVWDSPQLRPTMDIDLLGRTSNEESRIISQISEILTIDIESDGLEFLVDTLHAEPITEEADYAGIRVCFKGYLDTARITMQLDIGFGDVVLPEPELLSFPVLLDSPSPILFCYSKESAIAEKYHAIVKLGMLNSRMKDFFDIWLLSRQFSFDRATLNKAIALTFKNRDTVIPETVLAFTDEFCEAKQVLWTAFRKRIGQDFIAENFKDVIHEVQEFLIQD
jgi:hypothetical protein